MSIVVKFELCRRIRSPFIAEDGMIVSQELHFIYSNVFMNLNNNDQPITKFVFILLRCTALHILSSILPTRKKKNKTTRSCNIFCVKKIIFQTHCFYNMFCDLELLSWKRLEIEWYK